MSGVFEGVSPAQQRKIVETLENSHPGLPGLTIVQRLTRDLDQAFAEFKTAENAEFGDQRNIGHTEGIAEGIAHALGVMRNSSADYEWECATARYERRRSHAV